MNLADEMRKLALEKVDEKVIDNMVNNHIEHIRKYAEEGRNEYICSQGDYYEDMPDGSCRSVETTERGYEIVRERLVQMGFRVNYHPNIHGRPIKAWLDIYW